MVDANSQHETTQNHLGRLRACLWRTALIVSIHVGSPILNVASTFWLQPQQIDVEQQKLFFFFFDAFLAITLASTVFYITVAFTAYSITGGFFKLLMWTRDLQISRYLPGLCQQIRILLYLALKNEQLPGSGSFCLHTHCCTAPPLSRKPI